MTAGVWAFGGAGCMGEYRGLYVLTEAVRRSRVGVRKLQLGVNGSAPPPQTTGYMLKADWNDLDVAVQQYTPYIVMPLDQRATAEGDEAARAAAVVVLPRSGASLTMTYPTHARLPTTALAAARDWVGAALQRFEATLFSPPSDTWRAQVGAHVDEGSFIDYLLLQVRPKPNLTHILPTSIAG